MLSPQPSENAPTLEICTTAVYRGGLANLQLGVLRQLGRGTKWPSSGSMPWPVALIALFRRIDWL